MMGKPSETLSIFWRPSRWQQGAFAAHYPLVPDVAFCLVMGLAVAKVARTKLDTRVIAV